MATRTELILLQRTMVVVEGVTRTLDPQINIWATARPVVETYIRSNIGPRALLRDGLRVLEALGRHGPLLPEIVDRQLDQLSRPQPLPVVVDRRPPLWLVAVALLSAGTALGALLS